LKRPLSIALITLILFNTTGYYGLLLVLQYHHEQKLMQTLDNNDEKLPGTTTIRIPITIPYSTDSRGYERVDGIFEHHGEFFRLVKQRLYRDTLEIICIRDAQHKKINQAFVSHAGSITDKAGNIPNLKNFEVNKEYLSTQVCVAAAAEGWRTTLSVTPLDIAPIPAHLSLIIDPPEHI
jgi:hypothetical protein